MSTLTISDSCCGGKVHMGYHRVGSAFVTPQEAIRHGILKIAVASTLVVLISAGCGRKEASEPSASPSIAEPEQMGYVLSNVERNALMAVVADESGALISGGDSVLGVHAGIEGSVFVNDVARAYEANEVAADRAYFDKKLLVSGKVSSIRSGLGNKPYIVLASKNQFIEPQAHFKDSDGARAAELKKGQSLVLVCQGGGAVVGTAMFKNCRFANEVAEEESENFLAEAQRFLRTGEASKEVAALVLYTLAGTRLMPHDSSCAKDGDRGCTKEISRALNFSQPEIEKAMKQTIDAFRAKGVVVSLPAMKKSA